MLIVRIQLVITIDINGIPIIYIPIALRFGLEDGLTPTPSRESLILNQSSKDQSIKSKPSLSLKQSAMIY